MSRCDANVYPVIIYCRFAKEKNLDKLVMLPIAALLMAPMAVSHAAEAAQQGNPADRPAHLASTATLADFIRAYEADVNSVGRYYDLPWATARYDRLEKLYADWRGRLESVDFAALGQSGQVDYVLLRNELEKSVAEIARERQRLAAMDQLLKFRGAIHELEQARWRGVAVDGQSAAGKINEVANQAKQLKEQVEKAKKEERPSPALALRVAGATGELRGTLKRWFDFYNGSKPDFSFWLKTPYEEAGKQLDDYTKFLREEVAGQKGKDEDPLIGDPIGSAAVAESIRFEFLPYTAKELIAIGERELAWCEGEMKRAAREMGCGDDWKDALAKVKGDFVPPGQQDELVASLAHEAIAFTQQHRFATVPPLCEETWRLTMMSPEAMKTSPYVAYGGQQIMIAFANAEMKQEDKLMAMRGNNRAFTHLTVMHELIPGHHLQTFQSARHKKYREPFGTPFYVEGWAVYCELRFWELGWARSPQDRIGMLFWRMTRAARIIVTLNYHLGRMKPEEMVDFFVNRVGHERFGATSEVRRFIGDSFSPLYQAGYLLGGKQLLALHDDMVGDGKLTEQQFNDAVLANSPIPIEMLRAELRQMPLTRETQPAWRFAH